MIQGSIVAMVTPMHPDGSLDLDAYRRLIDWHVAEGTDAIVAVGTTGESPTVSVDEHCALIRVAVEQSAGRIPIIAGAGGNSTAEAIELTRFAKSVGADASLSVVPYYNKPTQEGLYRHFAAIAEGGRPAGHPVQRAGPHGGRSRERHRRAARVGAGHRRHQGRDRRHRPRHRADRGACRRDFAVYSGDDASAVALMLMGGAATSRSRPTSRRARCTSCARRRSPATRRPRATGTSRRSACIACRASNRTRSPTKWALPQMGLIEAGHPPAARAAVAAAQHARCSTRCGSPAPCNNRRDRRLAA